MNNYNTAFDKYETLFLKDNKQPYILQDIYQNKDNKDNNENLNIIYSKLYLIHKALNLNKLNNLMKVKYNKQYNSINEYENQCKEVIKFCNDYNKFIDNNEQECLKVLKNNSIIIDTKLNIKKI